MRALKCQILVDEDHRATVQLPTDVLPGEIEITLLLPEKGASEFPIQTDPSDEFEDLLSASESTFDFWDNPIDDEAWNLA